MPFKTTRTQNNHQVAFEGNSSVKHLRGWSSKNRNSSQTPLPLGTHFSVIQMMKRSMHGKPVFPMMIRNVPNKSGKVANWKDTIEFGVNVKPKSLNIDAGVKKPLIKITMSEM